VGVTGPLARGLAVFFTAFTAVVLGFVGLHAFLAHQHPPVFGTSWLDICYYDFQLFLLGSAPLGGPGPFPVTLEVARFLAPVTTVLAGFEALRLLLGEQIRRWTAAYAPNHAIVTGGGQMAMELARRLRSDQFRTVVLAGAKPETIDQARQLQLLDVAGDPSDISTLQAAGISRASVIYACSDQSATNAATALSARQFTKENGRPLLVHALIRDPDICTALRARRIGVPSDPRFRLEFFTIEGLAARALFDQYPITSANGDTARVIVVGFGALGSAVLNEIAVRHEPHTPKVGVTIVGSQSVPTDPAAYAREFPIVARGCDVSFQPVIPKTEPGTATLIIVCSPENDDALRTGLSALAMLTNRSDRIVICMSELSPFGKTFKADMLDDVQGRLSVFDVLEEACAPDQITFDLSDQLARSIHRAYIDAGRSRGETPEINPSMRPWRELPELLKDANTAQANHIGTKLDAIGCVLVPESSLLPDFTFTPDEVERLAVMEHERWMQDRAAHGIAYGPARDNTHHPDMVEWARLNEMTKDKDRGVIWNLPDIVRQAGFQILRLDPLDPATPTQD
jgi:voltage-gated potassium channel Kch